MTDITEKNQKSILSTTTLGILADLADVHKSMSLKLVKGKCPSIRSLQASQFPPGSLRANDIPVSFTVEIKHRTFEVPLMISLVVGNSGYVTVLGYVTHDKIREFNEYEEGKTIEGKHFSVAVKYTDGSREGTLHLYKDLYELIEKL